MTKSRPEPAVKVGMKTNNVRTNKFCFNYRNIVFYYFLIIFDITYVKYTFKY